MVITTTEASKFAEEDGALVQRAGWGVQDDKLATNHLRSALVEKSDWTPETSEENILFDIKEIMRQQIIPSERLLGFEMAWDVHWNCLGIEDDQFINTDDDAAQSPEMTFRVREDEPLSGGTDALAKLRQAISQFLDDFIDTRRSAPTIGALPPHRVSLRGRQEITFTNMTPGFWRLARRPRGAYPHGYVTSGQRGQRSKDQVRLERLFLGGP